MRELKLKEKEIVREKIKEELRLETGCEAEDSSEAELIEAASNNFYSNIKCQNQKPSYQGEYTIWNCLIIITYESIIKKFKPKKKAAGTVMQHTVGKVGWHNNDLWFINIEFIIVITCISFLYNYEKILLEIFKKFLETSNKFKHKILHIQLQ